MSLPDFLIEATKWLTWLATGLGLLTIIAFIINWGIKFRLVGASIFTFLLCGSCLAFAKSYEPPYLVEGAIYAPVVYDNGSDLVVAQANEDFPLEAIEPSLMQIAGNLKGGGRNGAKVHIRLRKLEPLSNEITKPVILGEVIKDINSEAIFKSFSSANEA